MSEEIKDEIKKNILTKKTSKDMLIKKEKELEQRENALEIQELNLSKKTSGSAGRIAIIVSNTKAAFDTSNIPFDCFFLSADEFLGSENFRGVKHFYTDDTYMKQMVEKTIQSDPKGGCTFFDIKA